MCENCKYILTCTLKNSSLVERLNYFCFKEKEKKEECKKEVKKVEE